MKSALEKIETLLYLHACEQEGIETGMPTRQQWLIAVEDANKALQELRQIDLPALLRKQRELCGQEYLKMWALGYEDVIFITDAPSPLDGKEEKDG